jgi:Family of unknown function (DUF5335)
MTCLGLGVLRQSFLPAAALSAVAMLSAGLLHSSNPTTPPQRLARQLVAHGRAEIPAGVREWPTMPSILGGAILGALVGIILLHCHRPWNRGHGGALNGLQDSAMGIPERVPFMSHTLSKAEMRELFHRLTQQLAGERAEVEIASLHLGDQFEAQWVPLLGLSYDPGDDAIAIVLEGIDITIAKPREIYLDGADNQWTALDIVDADGVQHIVQLKEPLLLPSAQ